METLTGFESSANRALEPPLSPAPPSHLGGKPFLDEITSAHKAYGEALGITAVKVAPESPAIRVARDNATDVIRSYVLRVAALVRKSDPQTEALSQRLLAPLVNWRARPAKAAEAEPVAAPTPPASTAHLDATNASTTP